MNPKWKFTFGVNFEVKFWNFKNVFQMTHEGFSWHCMSYINIFDTKWHNKPCVTSPSPGNQVGGLPGGVNIIAKKIEAFKKYMKETLCEFLFFGWYVLSRLCSYKFSKHHKSMKKIYLIGKFAFEVKFKFEFWNVQNDF